MFSCDAPVDRKVGRHAQAGWNVAGVVAVGTFADVRKRFSPKTPPRARSGMPSSPCSRACSTSLLVQKDFARMRSLSGSSTEDEGQPAVLRFGGWDGM